MPFSIVRNDITKMETDAIVNAANSRLLMGGGVCGAIFNAAGAEKMQAACDKIGFCGLGEAVITKGFNLKAKNKVDCISAYFVRNIRLSEVRGDHNCKTSDKGFP